MQFQRLYFRLNSIFRSQSRGRSSQLLCAQRCNLVDCPNTSERKILYLDAQPTIELDDRQSSHITVSHCHITSLHILADLLYGSAECGKCLFMTFTNFLYLVLFLNKCILLLCQLFHFCSINVCSFTILATVDHITGGKKQKTEGITLQSLNKGVRKESRNSVLMSDHHHLSREK